MKQIKTERGQSLVELAISIVLLLLLLSGTVELGMAFFQFIQLRDAAQEGALYGAVTPYIDNNKNGKYDAGELNPDIEVRVRNASNSPINLADTSLVTVDITSEIGTYCEGDGLKVRVNFDHKVFMPFMSAIIGKTLPLHAEVIDTVLAPICPP